MCTQYVADIIKEHLVWIFRFIKCVVFLIPERLVAFLPWY